MLGVCVNACVFACVCMCMSLPVCTRVCCFFAESRVKGKATCNHAYLFSCSITTANLPFIPHSLGDCLKVRVACFHHTASHNDTRSEKVWGVNECVCMCVWRVCV